MVIKTPGYCFFPEKYQYRKHGILNLPQIKNEDDFNTATADAIIMHARIPYVSKGATLRHAKRILTTYPNDRNGEWLEDVSKTKQEIETGRTSLTINNWSRMRTVGFIVTLLLIAFSAIIFL